MLHPAVGSIEQGLDLVIGERPPPGPALVLGDMGDPVVLVEDLLGCLPEPLQALLRPAVTPVGRELHEERERGLVAPAGRHRDRVRAARRLQVRDERLPVSWRPLPRIGAGELHQPPDQRHPPLDRPVLVQETGLLLAHPPGQHRLQQRRLRIEVGHTASELQVRRTRQIGSLRHKHLRCIKYNIVEASAACLPPQSRKLASQDLEALGMPS